ncbi:hypothetical protein K443DRAFT_8111 [Laccaria amethystina LaAM-08-1]|uniref:Uncharacterized protein n=1 Tax=Laccaria amethystina LaAM-08-1 TaxID=1095629 RepID=A0A0C9XE12_9AGAR|nr:hypothetical protein K443DRAFT_8111 [Laccaria amethystina LaAM-08-1]
MERKELVLFPVKVEEEKEASGSPIEVGGLSSADGDAKRGGEGVVDDGNRVGGDGRLIQALGIEARKCELKNDEMNIANTILDKDGSALVFKGPVHRTEKKTETGLNRTD